LQLFMDHGYLKQLRQMIILLLIGIINWGITGKILVPPF
jgi:hypothetical protein